MGSVLLPISTSRPPEAPTLTLGSSGIAISPTTGEVRIPDGLPLSDAARAFWTALREAFPEMEWCKR